MTNFTESKPYTQSMTILGAVLAIAAPIASVAGYQVTAADTAAIISNVSTVAGGLGGIIAFIGRFRATKKIG